MSCLDNEPYIGDCWISSHLDVDHYIFFKFERCHVGATSEHGTHFSVVSQTAQYEQYIPPT